MSLPLSATAFAALMAALPSPPPGAALATACSGGADSLALALLLRDWCAARRHPLAALIVDHRLRPESSTEAQQARTLLQVAGVAAQILTRDGGPPSGNLQNAARRARYGLLLDWVRAHGAWGLCLAHHQEDQAETVLLRLGRGSGVDGLAAMAVATRRDGTWLLRPLLETPRARLRAVVAAAGLAPIEDPSNHNLGFARVRWRRLAPLLAAEGITAIGLAATARRLRAARTALDAAAADLLRRAGGVGGDGIARLDAATLAQAPEELTRRALAQTVRCLNGAPAPRGAGIRRFVALLTAESGGGTLAGCQALRRGGALWIGREATAVAPPLALTAAGRWRWDRRVRFDISADDIGAHVAALGRDGWRQAQRAGWSAALADAPAFIRWTAPGLWRGATLLRVLTGAPPAGWDAAFTPRTAAAGDDASLLPDAVEHKFDEEEGMC